MRFNQIPPQMYPFKFAARDTFVAKSPRGKIRDTVQSSQHVSNLQIASSRT